MILVFAADFCFQRFCQLISVFDLRVILPVPHHLVHLVDFVRNMLREAAVWLVFQCKKLLEATIQPSEEPIFCGIFPYAWTSFLILRKLWHFLRGECLCQRSNAGIIFPLLRFKQALRCITLITLPDFFLIGWPQSILQDFRQYFVYAHFQVLHVLVWYYLVST